MTLTIAATIVPGQGDAATNHRVLIPRIASAFPGNREMQPFGTINVQLDQPLDRSYADFWTPQIPGFPVQLGGAKPVPRTEGFGFIRIELDARLTGQLILPGSSCPKARFDLSRGKAEIIASEFIDGVALWRALRRPTGPQPGIAAPPGLVQTYGKSLKDK